MRSLIDEAIEQRQNECFLPADKIGSLIDIPCRVLPARQEPIQQPAVFFGDLVYETNWAKDR